MADSSSRKLEALAIESIFAHHPKPLKSQINPPKPRRYLRPRSAKARTCLKRQRGRVISRRYLRWPILPPWPSLDLRSHSVMDECRRVRFSALHSTLWSRVCVAVSGNADSKQLRPPENPTTRLCYPVGLHDSPRLRHIWLYARHFSEFSGMRSCCSSVDRSPSAAAMRGSTRTGTIPLSWLWITAASGAAPRKLHEPDESKVSGTRRFEEIYPSVALGLTRADA